MVRFCKKNTNTHTKTTSHSGITTRSLNPSSFARSSIFWEMKLVKARENKSFEEHLRELGVLRLEKRNLITLYNHLKRKLGPSGVGLSSSKQKNKTKLTSCARASFRLPVRTNFFTESCVTPWHRCPRKWLNPHAQRYLQDVALGDVGWWRTGKCWVNGWLDDLILGKQAWFEKTKTSAVVLVRKQLHLTSGWELATKSRLGSLQWITLYHNLLTNTQHKHWINHSFLERRERDGWSSFLSYRAVCLAAFREPEE